MISPPYPDPVVSVALPAQQDVPASSGARVYLAYHKESPRIASATLQPIHVGRVAAETPLAGMPGDATGENISHLNPEYCELTAHFWAWKNNRDASTIGLMHYRRLLDLSPVPQDTRHPERFVMDFDAANYMAEADRSLASDSLGAVVAPRPIRMRRSVETQYAHCHDAGDLALLRDLIAEMRPDFRPDFERSLGGNRLIIGNIFIMRRDIFDHYSALLFPLLAAVHRRRQPEGRSAYQRRYIGFLAERIFSAYVMGDLMREQFSGPEVTHRTILNIGRSDVTAANPLRLARMVAKGQIGLRDLTGTLRNRYKNAGSGAL
ncbi:DUF4422 domain-containing protein [Paracoccus cavernae]